MNGPSAAAYFRRPPLLAQLFDRLLGDWPLVGRTVPLGREAFAALFQPRPSFADYLPFAGYDAEEGVFLLDDGCRSARCFDWRRRIWTPAPRNGWPNSTTSSITCCGSCRPRTKTGR